MPNISVQILSLNIALFLFNFVFIQIILRKLSENTRLKEQLEQGPQQENVKASEKAQKIITEAIESANRIINKASETVGQIDTHTNSKLAQLSQVQFTSLETSTEKFRDTNEKLFKDLSDKFAVQVEDIALQLKEKELKTVELISENINTQILDTNKQMVSMVKQDFAKAKASVDEYRKAKEQEIDLVASKLIKDVVRKVLPQVLSKEMHEELILDGIQKAKADGVFL